MQVMLRPGQLVQLGRGDNAQFGMVVSEPEGTRVDVMFDGAVQKLVATRLRPVDTIASHPPVTASVGA